MPHLVQMDKRYGKKGLQIIGVERQNSSTEDIARIVKKMKMKFPVASGGSGPVQTRGIPHMFVFSAKGKLVYSGYPNDDAEKVIKKELRKVDGGDTTKRFGLPERKKSLTEMREWTNADGKTVKAELVAIDSEAGTVTLKLANGRTVTGYDSSKLSEDDQKLIKELAGGDEEESGTDDPFGN